MKYVYWLRKDKEVNSGVVLHKFWINGCYFRYNWCKLLYYCHLQGHPTLFACFSQCLWSALENFLSSSNASAQECSNGLSFLWEGEHSVYKGFCDEGRSHPFWQSKGLAFLQSFMLLMCSQKKEVHSLKFLKIKALCASWQCFSIWGMKDPHYEVLMLVEMLSISLLPSIYLADPSLFH